MVCGDVTIHVPCRAESDLNSILRSSRGGTDARDYVMQDRNRGSSFIPGDSVLLEIVDAVLRSVERRANHQFHLRAAAVDTV